MAVGIPASISTFAFMSRSLGICDRNMGDGLRRRTNASRTMVAHSFGYALYATRFRHLGKPAASSSHNGRLAGFTQLAGFFNGLTEKLTCKGNFVIGSDGLTVRNSGPRVWITKVSSCFPCCAMSQSGDVLEVKSMTESKVSSVSRSNSSPIEEVAT